MCCAAMRVREPSSLRLVREFPKSSLKLASEESPTPCIFGQSLQSNGTLLLSELFTRRVKSLDVQTGALQLLFQEREASWLMSNARLLDSQQVDMLVVTECIYQGDRTRVVMAKKSTSGIYKTDHAVLLDETFTVRLPELFFEK